MFNGHGVAVRFYGRLRYITVTAGHALDRGRSSVFSRTYLWLVGQDANGDGQMRGCV